MQPGVIKQLGCLPEKQFMQVGDLAVSATAVLGREAPDGHMLDAELQAPVEELARLGGPVIMAGLDVDLGAARKSAVAVHDHADMPGNRCLLKLPQQALLIEPVGRPGNPAGQAQGPEFG